MRYIFITSVYRIPDEVYEDFLKDFVGGFIHELPLDGLDDLIKGERLTWNTSETVGDKGHVMTGVTTMQVSTEVIVSPKQYEVIWNLWDRFVGRHKKF